MCNTVISGESMLIAFADPSMEMLVSAQSRRVKVLGGYR